MPSFFSQKLTKLSNHYIDWSRIGNLIQSGNHTYSSSELLTRGAIITVTATAAFLGYYFNNSKETNYSDTSATLLCGLAGFVLSHTFVIAPLIQKRCETSRKCNATINEIKLKLSSDEIKPFASKILDTIEHINTLSLSDDKHARASETWGRRLALLMQVQDSFAWSREKFADFWIKDVDFIIRNLSEQRINKVFRLR